MHFVRAELVVRQRCAAVLPLRQRAVSSWQRRGHGVPVQFGLHGESQCICCHTTAQPLAGVGVTDVQLLRRAPMEARARRARLVPTSLAWGPRAACSAPPTPSRCPQRRRRAPRARSARLGSTRMQPGRRASTTRASRASRTASAKTTRSPCARATTASLRCRPLAQGATWRATAPQARKET